MIGRLAAWERRQFAQLWIGAIVLSVVLIVAPIGRAGGFWLLPYPTWNPLTWLRTFGLIAQHDPLLAIALLLPLGAFAITVAALRARRARATARVNRASP
jgi:hypothetical protein